MAVPADERQPVPIASQFVYDTCHKSFRRRHDITRYKCQKFRGSERSHSFGIPEGMNINRHM